MKAVWSATGTLHAWREGDTEAVCQSTLRTWVKAEGWDPQHRFACKRCVYLTMDSELRALHQRVDTVTHAQFASMVASERDADHAFGISPRRGWQGCQLVNPYCPNDLCDLPRGHEGWNNAVHRLSTMVEPTSYRWFAGCFVFDPTDLTEAELMQVGHYMQGWDDLGDGDSSEPMGLPEALLHVLRARRPEPEPERISWRAS